MYKAFIAIAVFLAAFYSKASETLDIEWPQLIAQTSETEIEFPELTLDQKGSLSRVLRLTGSQDQDSQKQLKHEVATLAEQGLDAYKLLMLREEYIQAQELKATAITTEFNGQSIRMPGFIVPIEFSANMVATEFLLVPYAGACIHMPPPPANQIVRVTFPDGYQVKNVKHPVWVEGTLLAKVQTEDLYVIDGNRDVTMGYELNASQVVDY